MTIAILIHDRKKHTVPRPFNRASSHGEMAEVIANYEAKQRGMGRDDAKAHASIASEDAVEYLELGNLDTDRPVYTVGHVRFYAFTEE
jgi:hypothetical protein